MKKNLIISIIIIAIVSGVVILFSLNKKQEISDVSQCQIKEMFFYYSDECKWCQKVKDEGTIDKIKKLGVKIKEINVDVGPIRHNFQGVPTFVINEKIYSSYKTFEDLSDLLNCPKEKQNLSNQNLEQINQKNYIINNTEEAQIIKMDLTYSGYVPNILYAKKGIPIKWIVNVKQMSGCTNAIIMPDYNIEKKLEYGENIIEFTPQESGEIQFSCWMGMVNGIFIIT